MIFLCLTVLAFAISWLQLSMIKHQERVASWKLRKGIQAVLLALALAIFLVDTSDPASRMLFVLMALLCVIPPMPRHSFFGHMAGLVELYPMAREAMQAALKQRRSKSRPTPDEPEGTAGP